MEPVWDTERNEIFEPMPFKGDINMASDIAGRAALDAEEGDNQLMLGVQKSGQSESLLDLFGGSTPIT